MKPSKMYYRIGILGDSPCTGDLRSLQLLSCQMLTQG